MINLIKKYVNFYTLGAINLAIILSAELSGSFFFDTGLIHLVTFLFVFVAIPFNFMAVKQLFADLYLKTYFKLIFTILIIFSITHILEYLIGENILPLNHEAAGVFVLCSYAVGILLIITAVEYLLGFLGRKATGGKPRWIFILSIFLSACLGVLSVYVLLSEHTDELFNRITGLAAVFIVAIGTFAIFRISMLKKAIPILENFVSYFSFTILFVVLSGIFEYFEVSEMGLFSEMQSTYFAHFFIYIAISFYILGLSELLAPRGIYKDIRNSLSKERPAKALAQASNKSKKSIRTEG